MIPAAFDPQLLTNPMDFPDRIVESLGTHPCDFQESFRQIRDSGERNSRKRAAGVLLPLLFKESSADGKGAFVFQLIKRSAAVPQSGDLSLPGGMLHPVDHLLRQFLIHRPFSPPEGKALAYARDRQSPAFRLITLFLANALRESWEEIRLRPDRIRFLGPLPTYSLTLFQRTIFPLAGFVENAAPPKPNREVEKVVEIPLASFFQDERYGSLHIVPPDPAGRALAQYPCLIFHDGSGEEILWGATFHIITGFLRIVTGFCLPGWKKGRVVRRILHPDYLTGRPGQGKNLRT